MNQKQQMLDNAIAGMKNPATRKAFEDAISANRVRRLSDQLNTKLVCDNRGVRA